ncbi:E3 ubiquitin-protein ligase TRIM45-like [Saccostrea cucullata]|uniref:E3 ubiquitin-protein ligase TRIM45-like n=1 Tax=Saccostrea cuccullata TaxID=36930 RepID=UPI002ED0F4A4
MATPISWAQDVITCDLCDNPTEQFCNNCQVSLCVDCVSKHVDSRKSLPHEIVPFKNRKKPMVCEAYCQQCDGPVCFKCILDNHKGDDGVELSKVVANKKEEIEKDTNEIETVIIPKCEKREKETKVRASKCTAKYEELEEETEEHRILWHKEVDTIFNKFCCLIKSLRDDHLHTLETHQNDLKTLIPEMKKTVERNKEILNNDRLSEVINYKSNIIEYRNIQTDIHFEIPSLNAKIVQGSELKIEVGGYMSTLTHNLDLFTSELNKVIATIPTKVKPLLKVVCVGSDKAWISGKDTTIYCVDIHGEVQDSIKTASLERPTDITLTKQGDLIYTDYKNKTLNIVRQGRIEVLVTTQEGWKPRGLCATGSGDVLVNLYNGSRNKIVLFQGQTVKQEIYKDGNGKEIFKRGKFKLLLSENNNEDICISDPNANMVIVLDNVGCVRFRYDGTPARKEEVFCPSQVVTDSMNQIIVADYNNDCLHILDENGQFLRCVNSCELNSPYGLSVDTEGRIWVGLCYSGEIKVIQYMK